MSSHLPLHELPRIIIREQGAEVAPALPAPSTTMVLKVEGRDTEADHSPHIVPDILAGKL